MDKTGTAGLGTSSEMVKNEGLLKAKLFLSDEKAESGARHFVNGAPGLGSGGRENGGHQTAATK